MVAPTKSRWADDEDDAAVDAQRKREKEEKKRAKAEKQRRADEAAAAAAEKQQQQQQAALAQEQQEAQSQHGELSSRPAKRRKTSPEPAQRPHGAAALLRFSAPGWRQCRSVEDFDKLNEIEEGAYGWVSRAKDSASGRVVALKRLKMENAQDGIPVTGLREIQTLMDSDHPNIVGLQEVVVGEDMTKIEK